MVGVFVFWVWLLVGFNICFGFSVVVLGEFCEFSVFFCMLGEIVGKWLVVSVYFM